jgi:hypothetical protein
MAEKETHLLGWMRNEVLQLLQKRKHSLYKIYQKIGAQ